MLFMLSYLPMMFAALGLSGSAGNHLLDYASTDAYWKAKGVAVSVDAMLAEIKMAPAEDVGALVKDLGSADPQVRELATRKLLAKGPAVLPQLQEAAKSPDPETAAAVGGIIEQINLVAKAASVRRLMAIRTLGELKKPQALPALKALAATDCCGTARGAGVTPFIASATARRCSGVVPQQPPTTCTPYSVTNRRR